MRTHDLIVAGLVALLAAAPADAHLGSHPQCFSEPPPANSEGPPDEEGFWEPIVDLGVQAIHAIHLPLTGEVLVWGYNGGGAGTAGAIYDPETGAVTDITVPHPAFCSGHAHLPDGKVLIAGGLGRRGAGFSTVFDPADRTFTAPVALNGRRYYPTLTSLADGRVFTASGSGGKAVIPEIYDPGSDAWTQIGCEPRPSGRLSCRKSRIRMHWYPRTALTPDGQLFLTPASRSLWAHSFDFTTELWTRHEIGTDRRGKMTPAPGVYYAPTRILRAGTDKYSHASSATADASIVEFDDVASPVYREIGPMDYARNRNSMTILADGTVLVTGGIRTTNCAGPTDPHVYHPELWDPATETWETLGPMQAHRVYHSSAVLLRDGSILSAGGEPHQKTSQIFRPPYLFKGPRPVITSAPATLDWGEVFDVGTPDPAAVAAVHLLRLGAATHAYDESQLIARLAFTPEVDRVTVTAPGDGYAAPPGYWLLFLISDQGVPSIGEYVRVTAPGYGS